MSNFTDTTTSEQYWVYQQEEPESRLITGNAKRYESVKPYVPPAKYGCLNKPDKQLTEQEENDIQDAYLKRYGI